MLCNFGVDSLIEPAIVEKDMVHHFDGLYDKIVLTHNFL